MSTKNISKDYIITNYATNLSELAAATPLTPIPFRLSFTGPPNLRNQSTSQHYETFIGEQKT
jgi:hypothetical protein